MGTVHEKERGISPSRRKMKITEKKMKNRPKAKKKGTVRPQKR